MNKPMKNDTKTIWPLDSLHEWEQNPRSITRDGFTRLKKQIEKLGQYKPLLVKPDGTVLGGNMRLKAYRELGISDIWVSIIEPQDDAEALEYALSDNDRAGFYDDDLLANLIPEYPDFAWQDYAVDLKEPTNLGELIDRFTPVDEDDVPAVEQGESISQLGEVYQIGRHRLMCGDATRIEDAEKLMDGQKADMVFTDPPYGYSYESNHQKTHDMLMNDDKFLDFFPTLYVITKDPCAVYMCCGWQTVKEWAQLVSVAGLTIKNHIIWKKNNWSMGDLEGAYAGQYEIILFAHRGRVTLRNGRDQDVWEFDRVPPTDHPTMKPVELVARAIRNSSSTYDIVLDLFGGSGSTLIACEQTNRICYMMELDPKYCDVIRKRYAKFIGEEERWQEVTPIIDYAQNQLVKSTT